MVGIGFAPIGWVDVEPRTINGRLLAPSHKRWMLSLPIDVSIPIYNFILFRGDGPGSPNVVLKVGSGVSSRGHTSPSLHPDPMGT